MKKRVWTLPEIELLKQFYGILPVKSIAYMLKRTPRAVYTQAYRLGITSCVNAGRRAKYIKICKSDKNSH